MKSILIICSKSTFLHNKHIMWRMASSEQKSFKHFPGDKATRKELLRFWSIFLSVNNSFYDSNICSDSGPFLESVTLSRTCMNIKFDELLVPCWYLLVISNISVLVLMLGLFHDNCLLFQIHLKRHSIYQPDGVKNIYSHTFKYHPRLLYIHLSTSLSFFLSPSLYFSLSLSLPFLLFSGGLQASSPAHEMTVPHSCDS